ncbi:hypothetical protein [Bosea sp. WAO]|uniref:hypothetical protein n=1 Tax=Bosea sp. WAO TaxID=406341 RepID=UPI00082A7012|nr:hypothetical protein [Bosea sp. WAO]
MRAQTNQAPPSDKTANLTVPTPLELYRELCQDEDGNRYAVIVWLVFPNLNVTSYALEDGTPVTYLDECRFEIASTGTVVTRCL